MINLLIYLLVDRLSSHTCLFSLSLSIIIQHLYFSHLHPSLSFWLISARHPGIHVPGLKGLPPFLFCQPISPFLLHLFSLSFSSPDSMWYSSLCIKRPVNSYNLLKKRKIINATHEYCSDNWKIVLKKLQKLKKKTEKYNNSNNRKEKTSWEDSR